MPSGISHLIEIPVFDGMLAIEHLVSLVPRSIKPTISSPPMEVRVEFGQTPSKDVE